MEVLFFVLLGLAYYVFCVYSLVQLTRLNDDVSLGFFITICLVFWLIAPILLLVEGGRSEVILFKKFPIEKKR